MDAAGGLGGAQAPLHATPASAVLLVISDVTRVVQAQETGTDGRGQSVAQTEPAQAPSDLAAAYQEALAENARLKTQLDHLSAQNRALIQANVELGNDNLALRSANEELLVGHEEAEATAEEVKTLNEELQSTNEELVTLNEELEATVEELHAANEDLQARTNEQMEVVASEVRAAQGCRGGARAHRGYPAERRGCGARLWMRLVRRCMPPTPTHNSSAIQPATLWRRTWRDTPWRLRGLPCSGQPVASASR